MVVWSTWIGVEKNPMEGFSNQNSQSKKLWFVVLFAIVKGQCNKFQTSWPTKPYLEMFCGFLHLVFLGTCGHHILDYFCSFQVYCINFRLELVYVKNILTNIYKLEHMKYICVKKIHVTKYENCKYISKLRLWVECHNEFFGGEWYWSTSIKFKTI